ncbi:MAG: hypothetical protein EOM12_05695 [Verrucomicrobiae bacterium]|nr:hypothetical protein [Verrucomicrobiae bacterium]
MNLKRTAQRVARDMAHRRRSFNTNESGQVLLMVGILSLSLVMIAMTVIPVGQAITRKIQLQNAADAAAMTATTWMARGSNLQQILNGMHFDFDTFMVCTIVETYTQMLGEECSKCDWPPWDWIHCYHCSVYYPALHNKLKDLIQKQKSGAEKFKELQTTINYSIPFLGFLHANTVAEQNGAGDLKALGEFPLLKKLHLDSLVTALLGAIDQLASMFGITITTTTVNPSLNPIESLKFSREVSHGDSEYCGMWSCSYNMEWYTTCFECVLMPVYITYSWKDSYFLSTNVDQAVTFIVAAPSTKGFILNDLLLRDEDRKDKITDLIPAAYAFGSAKLTGDELYPGGMKGVTYFPIIMVGAFQWPLAYPIPWRFTSLGYNYEGKFSAEMCPVVIEGVDAFTKEIIYH